MFSKDSRINSTDKVINSLIDREFIYTSRVERIIRSVNSKLFACQLRSAELNFVAPCVTSTVLECLEMRPGHKLLNIGSENGYFNSMAGLLLGSTGVNHGIEIDQLLVDIANGRVENFKLNSAAIDHTIFCEPVFIQGNACKLSSTNYYDRVYCRPGVPPGQIEFMKSLIKIGGMLVMPLDKTLIRFTRIDELTFEAIELFRVSETELILPEETNIQTIAFPSVEPMSLKELCRITIRSSIYDNILKESPNMGINTKCQIDYDPDKKIFGLHDPISDNIRAQYDLCEEQIFYLMFPLDTFDDDSYTSDSSSDSSCSMLLVESVDVNYSSGVDEIIAHADSVPSVSDIFNVNEDDGTTEDNDDNKFNDEEEYDNDEKQNKTDDKGGNLDNGEKYDEKKISDDDNLGDGEKYDKKGKQRKTDGKKNGDDKNLDNEEKYDDNPDDREKYDDNKLDDEKEDAENKEDEIAVDNESTKRKSSVADECPECSEETEYSKRPRVDVSSQSSARVPILIEFPSDIDEVEGEVLLNEQSSTRFIYSSVRSMLTNEVMGPSDDDDESENEKYISYNDLLAYCFETDSQKNELSLLLKAKIDSLALPVSLKSF